MPKPGFNKPSRKGGGTSFGKQSHAEKSFYNRKKDRFDERDSSHSKKGRDDRFAQSNDRSGKPIRKRPSPTGGGYSSNRTERNQGGRSFHSRPSGFSTRRKDKPFNEHEKPFRPNRERPAGHERPRRNTDRFDKKPFQDRKSFQEKKPFQKEKRSFIQSRVIRSGEFTKTVKEKGTPKQEQAPKQEGLIRLNRYIANAGVGSRRQADELIKMGLISVNGVTITELGTKVKPGDIVRYEDRVLKAERLVYVLLNKPKGFITTTDDPQERNTVMSLVASAAKERIYPVGRLDRNTTGLLLLTNDGELADKLTHPSYKTKKIYKVELDKPLTKNDFDQIVSGVRLEEGRAMVDDLAVLSDDRKTVGLEIHIGWNRVVRRIFESLGYAVVKLDRSVFAGLDKKDLARGQWRFLRPEEVIRLKHFGKETAA